MPKEIWNEGRVTGLSAYEIYVKQHLVEDPANPPATEREWLSASIAMGSSMLLKVPEVGDKHTKSKDHTYVGMLLNTGKLSEESAKNHPGKNLLTRALGANDPIEIDIFDIDTSVKGLFLCSDGLTNMLTEEQIEKILNSNLPIEETVVKLIRKANSRGGTDNISIAYLKKESGEQ